MSAARAQRPVLELTEPVEDYLKAIHELERSDLPAETNAIARLLGIAPASVSGMMRRLVHHGLVTHERYRGVRLTAAGRRAALRTIRRHRVIEAYLTTALGYSWDRVHDEAERLEHAASDELVDRMAEAIGEPDTDPHGAPIPTREGALQERVLVPLSTLQAGSTARVEQVGERDAERLRYLGDLGLVPGTDVRLIAREPFGGPIALQIRDRKRTIGPELAAEVLVAVVGPRTRTRR